MSSGGIKVSRRQAEISTIFGKCVLPSKVDGLSVNPSAGWIYVGKGNVCRIRFTAVTGFALIGFTDDKGNTGSPGAKDQDTVEVDMAAVDKYHIVLAVGDYIKTSSAVARLEIAQA